MQYAGIKEEHLNVRRHAGIFDVCHMGEIETTGPGAEAFLQRILSNDVAKIAENGAQYRVLTKEDGGVLDDLFTYKLGEDRYLTVTNASNHEKDLAWFQKTGGAFDVTLHDRLHDYAMLAVQGPDAREIVAEPHRWRAAEALPDRQADGRRRPGRPRVRHRLHRRGRRRVAGRAPGRRRRSGTRSSRPARSLRASARATPCAWRSASTSTATT